MTSEFDRDYWEHHWQRAAGAGPFVEAAANPHLVRETADLLPGTALDAGCGEGTEALWLASAGWRVTAADLSAEVLARAADRARGTVTDEPVRWVQADLTVWQPGELFDLVTTHYAHPSMPQLAFYDRISRWVAPHGTLLVVGHRRDADGAGQAHEADHRDPDGREHEPAGHGPPTEATVTAPAVAALLDPSEWEVVTVAEEARTSTDREGRPVELHDVVVRATRLA